MNLKISFYPEKIMHAINSQKTFVSWSKIVAKSVGSNLPASTACIDHVLAVAS